MDANNSLMEKVIHVHNCSALAVRSFILEVKKNPLLYNYNIQFPSSALVDLSWKRVIKALLASSNNFDSSYIQYWVYGFRGLWGWIRHILVKDMQERSAQTVQNSNPQDNWLDLLKFLVPHIDLSSESSPYDRHLLNSGIQVEIFSSKSVVPGNYTIFWLSVAMESVQNRNDGISIFFRMPKTLLSGVVPFTQEVLEDDNSRLARNPAIEESISPQAFSENALQESDKPYTSTAIKNQTQQVLVQYSRYICMEAPNSVPPLTPQFKADLATQKTDDDFDYVLAFLPILYTLKPEEKTKMKVMIIQAIYEILSLDDIQY